MTKDETKFEDLTYDQQIKRDNADRPEDQDPEYADMVRKVHEKAKKAESDAEAKNQENQENSNS